MPQTTITPSSYYETLLATVDDGMERCVFWALANRIGEVVTREDLVRIVHGVEPMQNLADDPRDRKNRECIRRLRAKDFPIVSSSSDAGYTLKDDEAEIEKAIANLQSKINAMQDSVNHLRRSKNTARRLREWRQTQVNAVQGRLL